jgi:tRNA pseudouridine38-40 synthase
MSIIRLTLEYDGTDFVGWQFQNNGRSVQEEVEKAINKILQTNVRITGGGRTDAGVHARGQVASFKIDRDLDTNKFVKSLNSILPHDVIIREASEAPSDFDARHSAKSRRYKYYIKQEPISIQRNYCWQVFYHLDIGLMQKCAEIIQGEHNFFCFCKADTGAKHHQCIVHSANWTQQKEYLIFGIISNRFLYGMVRSLVGTMIDVGRGHTSIDDFIGLLNKKDKSSAGMYAPARGLFLEDINY